MTYVANWLPAPDLDHSFWSLAPCDLPDDVCWLWEGAKNGDGYGIIANKTHGRWLAHRLSLFLHGTDLRRSDCVLHSCDTPACVNPAHLRIGTKKDNGADARERGRMKKGKSKYCRRGHAFTKDNVYLDKHGWQHCRECDYQSRMRKRVKR